MPEFSADESAVVVASFGMPFDPAPQHAAVDVPARIARNLLHRIQ